MQVPELALSQDEAHLLAEATAEVASHYNIVPDPKAQAWINFGIAASAIYGPRLLGVSMKPGKGAARPAGGPISPPVVDAGKGDNVPVALPNAPGVVDWTAIANAVKPA